MKSGINVDVTPPTIAAKVVSGSTTGEIYPPAVAFDCADSSLLLLP